MLRLIPLLASVFAITSSLAQVVDEFSPNNVEWGEGTVLLNDGTELTGVIRYNDTEGGVVSFEGGNHSASWTARSVAGFNFFDEVKNRQRVFFTIDFDGVNGKRPTFFEVIKDFKSFAVLSAMDPIDVQRKTNSTPGHYNGTTWVAGSTGSSLRVEQTETIYFMDADETIHPYMKVIRRIVGRTFYDHAKFKNKVVDKGIAERYFGEPAYTQMIKYADDNDLDIAVKEDFIKLLDYYEQQFTRE